MQIKYHLLTDHHTDDHLSGNYMKIFTFDQILKLFSTLIILSVLVFYSYPLNRIYSTEIISTKLNQSYFEYIHTATNEIQLNVSMTKSSQTYDLTTTNKPMTITNIVKIKIPEIYSTTSDKTTGTTETLETIKTTSTTGSKRFSVTTGNITRIIPIPTTRTETNLATTSVTSSTTKTMARTTTPTTMLETTSITPTTRSKMIPTTTGNFSVTSPAMTPATTTIETTIFKKTITTNVTTKPITEKYFINTSGCRIPYVDPFSKEALKIFKKVPYKICAKDADLVSSIYDPSTRRYKLHLNDIVGYKYKKKALNSTDISCCYQQIVRSGSGSTVDNRFILTSCSNFHQNFVVPQHIDAMLVTCKIRNTSVEIQKHAFSFVQYKPANVAATNSANATKLSVLLIGIDSLSRINFRRNMPLTHKYLTDKQWFTLEGYSKMGDNTFPNLMALLTGYNNTQAFKYCKPQRVGGLDKCTYLWDSYKAHGYRTAYSEDWARYATFNYIKKGFEHPPTEYYLRPMVLAMEDNLKIVKSAGIPDCVGRRRFGEYIYDYALQMTNVYKDEPIFGIFWTNTFSHNDFRMPSSMDAKMLEYFKTLEKTDVLERAAVFFFSDHGMRFGSLRQLSSGFLEERLPMFYISLPKRFQAQHPDLVRALKINKYRLTSPYDAHITLHHLLELNVPGLKLPQPEGCSTCQSILREVPENRTCADAGISEHWCSCETYENVALSNTNIRTATKLVLEEINNYLTARNFSTICAQLTLKEIKNAEEKTISNDTISYRLEFEAAQKSALFEATANYELTARKVSINVESISRLSAYEKTSECVNDKQAKKYCICK